MAKVKAKRKRRTREHIIEEMSFNYFEKFALEKGFSVEKFLHDYGLDANLYFYDSAGLIQNGSTLIQLKASDNVTYISKGMEVTFTVDKRDLDYWLNEFNPVILVIYDAKLRKAYWLDLKEYFTKLPGFSLATMKSTINVNIPITNKIGKQSMNKFYNQIQKLYSTITF